MSSGIYNKVTGYHNRRSIRLPGYDYSQPGYYFVTMCIHDRSQNLFGDVVNGKMVSNELGTIAIKHIKCLPERFPNIKLDAFQIMPNHVHVVIPICGISVRGISVGATLAVAPTGTMETKKGNTKNVTIGDIIGAYKSLVSNECLKIYKSKNERMGKLWQRNYYENIVRDEKSLFFIRKYIHNNPIQWSKDTKKHIDHEIETFKLTETV